MYARVNTESDEIESQIGEVAPDGFGPYEPPPDNEPGIAYFLLAEPINWSSAPSKSSVLLWNGGSPNWVEGATLEALRDAKKEEINGWKLEANKTFFEFRGEKIRYLESDKMEIDSINAIVTLTGAMPTHTLWPKAWKAHSNNWVPIPDVATWIEFIESIGARGMTHFFRAQQLKVLVDNAKSVTDLEKIVWDMELPHPV